MMEKKRLAEASNGIEAFHGSQADFDNFSLAYALTGIGSNVYGKGVYVTDSMDAAKEYSHGHFVYTVTVPRRKYLSDSICRSRRTVQLLVSAFFKYYGEENDEGKNLYGNHLKEFWMDLAPLQRCLTLYELYSSLLGFADEDTIQSFLSRFGYVGLKIKDEHVKQNVYVIFDAKNVKIVKKENLNQ